MTILVTLISAVAGAFAIIAGIAGFARLMEPKLTTWRVHRALSRVDPEAREPDTTINARQATAKKERGKLHRQAGEFSDAERLFTEAFGDFVRLKDRKGQANALMNRGISFRMAGRFQEAERDHVAADSLYRLARNRPGRADNLKNLGRVYTDKGDAQQAIKIHNRSLKMYESMGNLSGMAELHQQLAIDFGALGDMASAKRHMDQVHRAL